ncbi:MAG: TolB family protein [Rudaea sp.]
MKKALIVSLLTVLLILAGGQVFAAGGAGPGDALLPVGVSQAVAAHSAQWYYFDYSGGKSTITANLDDNGASGIRLAIYTPDEITAWQNGDSLNAIGVGGPVPGHDLGWTGSFPFAGRFYAVVSNDGGNPVSVSLRVTGDNVTTSVVVIPTPTPFANPFATVTPLGRGITGKLAFVNSAGGFLYVVNGDGSGLHQVSTGMDPQWNHAGSQIALARQGPAAGVYTMSADGSNENQVYSTSEVRAPDWSPDDSTLMFSYQAASKGGGQFCFFGRCFQAPPNTLWRLATVSAAGGSYADVRATDHAFTPTWKNDGVTFAYNDLSIGIMQAATDNSYDTFPIIGDLRSTTPGYNPLKLMSPQYSPDGKSIVYMVYQQPAWQIAVANADGSNQRLLTRIDPLDFVHPNNVAPIWSPDSKQILFLSDRNGKWEFFLINADGSGVQQVLKTVSDQVTIGYEFESERMMTWAK